MRIGVLYNLVDVPEGKTERDIISDNEVFETVGLVKEALSDEHEVIPLRVRKDDLFNLTERSFDLIFNLCEGLEGNVRGEMWVASILEMAGLPFTGSDGLTLGLCLDKVRTKRLLMSKGIPTPAFQLFLSSSQELDGTLRFPLIVKPVAEDASVGISIDSVVNDRDELYKKVAYVIDTYHQGALVEEFIDGREFNVPLIGNGPAIEVLPISEIIFSLPPDMPNIVDYDAKWMPHTEIFKGTKNVCPAKLRSDVEDKIKMIAVEAYAVTGCRDYARVDFRFKDDVPYVLEINSNPCISRDSGFEKSAKARGWTHRELIHKVFHTAVERYGLKEWKGPRKTKAHESERLTAREPVIDDVPTVLKWFNDAEISRYMDSPGETYTEERLNSALFLADGGKGSDLIVSQKATGRKIGYASVYHIDREKRSGEISFLLGERDLRGAGLGKELVGLLVDLCFKELGLKRIYATVLPENVPSVRVFRALGFREVGTLRGSHWDGEGFRDELFFELSVPDAK